MKHIEPCRLATACLPWTESGDFLEEVFRREVRALRRSGFENLYIFGTAGEGYAVTDPVFRKVATVFMEEMRGSIGLVMLGVIGMSVAQIRARIEVGLELGYRAFQVSLPSWGTLTDLELSRFFRDVLGPYPEVAFLHYNTGRGGRVLTGTDYARLSAEHPNLVATKSGGHTSTSLLALFGNAPTLCHFVTEIDYATACLYGKTCGLLVSASAVHPHRCREFFEAGQRGDTDLLRRLTCELSLIRTRIIATVAGEGGHMDGAYDKFFVRLADPEFPIGLLSPYQGGGIEAFDGFKAWLEREVPGWDASRIDHHGV